MNRKISRSGRTLAIVALSLTALYAASWRYDPARLESCAMKGQAEAQYRLGKAYFDGYLVAKDNRIAATWLAKAAAQGHAKAQTGLAFMFAKGFGVNRSCAEAVKWYRKAADQNFAGAQNQLGVLYATGQGVPRDLDEAVKWFTKASDQGCSTSRKNLTLALAARSGSTARLTYKGKVYNSVKVEKVEPDGLTVSFEPERGGFGVAKIKFSDLPPELQQRYAFSVSTGSRGEAGLTQLTCLALQHL